MIFKLFNYFVILFLLQSCSGGGFGNFLELSFSNIEEEESKINQNNSNNQKVIINKKNFKDSNKSVISKTNKDFSKPSNQIKIKKQNLKPDDINNSQKVIKKNIIQDQNKKIKIKLIMILNHIR